MTSAIWRAGALPAAAVGLVVCLVALLGGAAGALGAVVGTVLALAALSVPVLVVRATSSSSPPAVMGAALGGYLVCVLVLAVAWTVFANRSWLSGGYLAVALFAVTTAWMAGQVVGLRRLRVLAFGSPGEAPRTGGDTPGQADKSPN